MQYLKILIIIVLVTLYILLFITFNLIKPAILIVIAT
jgi:hypothetical protein